MPKGSREEDADRKLSQLDRAEIRARAERDYFQEIELPRRVAKLERELTSLIDNPGLEVEFDVSKSYAAQDAPVSGELLNDEIEFSGSNALDPHKTYRVRYSWKGREFLGEWKD